MNLSVVTVSHNSARDLPRFVDSFLRSGSGRLVSIEFVLVENSGSAEVATLFEPIRDAGYKVTFVEMENRGFGAGCNRGAEVAQGEVLIFANPDVEFETPIDGVAKFSGGWGTVMQLTGDGRGHSFDLLPERKSIMWEIQRKYRRLTPPPEEFQEALVPIGSFFCVDRKLFQKVGGFNERFFLYHEEAELSRRLLRSSPPAFLSDIRVVHRAFGSQINTSTTLAHEADGLITYAAVTGVWQVVFTRAIFLLLAAPVSAVSRLRLLKLFRSLFVSFSKWIARV